MKHSAELTILLFLLCVANALWADSPQTLKNFEGRYNSARSMQAKFLERYYENGKLVRAEAGEAYFQRPGKMRWEYESPEKNTFLVDGKYVWFYSPADHTVTRMVVKQSEDWRTPLAFLTSHVKLSRICSQLTPDATAVPANPEDVVYACTMRGTIDAADGRAKGKTARLEISPEGELRRIVAEGEGGTTVEFTFGNWKFDPQLARGLFQFTPPSDAVIVDGLLPEGPGMRQ